MATEKPDTVIDSQKKIAELEGEIQRLSLFHEVGKALASTLDVQKILQTIMEKISDLLEPDNWSLLMLDPKTQELSFEIAIGDGSEKLKDVRIKVGEGIAGWAAQHAEAVLVEDARSDPRFNASLDALTNTVTRSVICMPIVGREGVFGVIELVNYVGRDSFRHEDLPTLRNLADYAAIALENARYVSRISELTITDDCTSLYNARHLNFVVDAEIYRSNRYQFPFALIFFDLDHFKQVNDTWGHLIGSKLLRKVGDLVKGNLRLIDYAFRYGGDEFVLLLPQTPKRDAFLAVRRLKDTLVGTPFLADEGLDLRVTASFGIATYPEDGVVRKDLLARADEAMYLSKNSGRNKITVYGEAESVKTA